MTAHHWQSFEQIPFNLFQKKKKRLKTTFQALTCLEKLLLTCDVVFSDLTAEWMTVRLGNFSSKTLDGFSSTSNSSSVLDTLPRKREENGREFKQLFQQTSEQILRVFGDRLGQIQTLLYSKKGWMKILPEHNPDLFIVGYCLDMVSCCNQSHISKRNLGWKL